MVRVSIDGGRARCDIHDLDNAVGLDLYHRDYSRLVIEVANPSTVAMIATAP
jgi:hypothetical protein